MSRSLRDTHGLLPSHIPVSAMVCAVCHRPWLAVAPFALYLHVGFDLCCVAGGSGSAYIYGFCDKNWKPDFTEEQCKDFVVSTAWCHNVHMLLRFTDPPCCHLRQAISLPNRVRH